MKAIQSPSILLFLGKNASKDGRYPVYLRVIYQRKSWQAIMKYPQREEPEMAGSAGKSIQLSKNDFDNATSIKPSGVNKIIAKIFSGFITKADEVIKTMKPFLFEKFETLYFAKPKDKDDLFSWKLQVRN
jgi:hypothetical protein